MNKKKGKQVNKKRHESQIFVSLLFFFFIFLRKYAEELNEDRNSKSK